MTSAQRPRIRFHLDESVDPAVARALGRHDLDVSTTVEAGLRTATDEEHWAFIRSSGRVIVTHDADCLRLAAAGADHPGIAYCAQGRRTVGAIVRRLVMIAANLRPEELEGRVL
ncbi:MAG: DUF5615 family PIN-like protein [Acidobacteriota bacterium]